MTWLAHWLTWQFSLSAAVFAVISTAAAVLYVSYSVQGLFEQRLRELATKAVAEVAAEAVRWNAIDGQLYGIDEQLARLAVRVDRLAGRQNVRVSIRRGNGPVTPKEPIP